MSAKDHGRSKKSGGRTRVALLVPSSNTVMENDLHRGLPSDRFTVHTDRMFLVETTREAESRMIEEFARPAAKDVGTTLRISSSSGARLRDRFSGSTTTQRFAGN